MKRQQALRFLAGTTLIMLIWAGLPLSSWATEPVEMTPTEQAVLDIVARHPDVILNSLTAYRHQQLAAEAEAKAKVLEQVRQNLPVFVGDSPVRGNPAAPVMLIEFADFECPFCVQAYQPIAALLQRHPQVRFVFKHLPLVGLHDQALPAARAAWAAGKQGKFWEFYDDLFASGEPLADDRYLRVAQQLGLNLRRWERDRNSIAAQQAIDADMAQAGELGITGTPSFLVVTPSSVVPVTGADLVTIEQVIDSSLD
ncbi:DsbA family protein [Leptolyngbya ohadii]|uniref:DsbA family protein n=1 Tax=Leptolyngbya ohadii TaxID=1962290 RepID=UPI000B59DC6B|nr:thioredoxin domain-containing protein [Leptolyngbya ohadii]